MLIRWWLNTLRPGQNGRHFTDDIFKRIFFNENVWISIKISLRFVPKGPINNIPALVQIMAWRRSGDKPFLNQWWVDYRRIYASLGLNELSPRNPFRQHTRKQPLNYLWSTWLISVSDGLASSQLMGPNFNTLRPNDACIYASVQ